MPYSFACRDFPGMGDCPGFFTSETRGELWHHIELHEREAHAGDPTQWSSDDRQTIEALIRSTRDHGGLGRPPDTQ